ncbi:surface carbohydrate biosynthesis protein [Pseudomonas sp. EA_35y_Pfl2_R111]|uniref:surface carbohydrate biosynthesis protein n=1 Tax=Pseudomonas sp. EA_35y_Pfl2_R111 TaxID=3088689 RepID=UPI0030DBA823
MSTQQAAKPTLYLPVEIKAREFKAKVLLALIAARQGFRVYLGSKVSIDRLVREKPEQGGIYFYKGGKAEKDLRAIKQRTERFVVLDEELGPAVQDLGYFYKRRIYPGTESYVDRLYVIGDVHREVIAQVRPQLIDKVEVTGWPRVDLWRADFKAPYASDIQALQNRFGQFLLFSSDFGILSEQTISQEVARLRQVKSSQEEYDHYERSMRAAYTDFLDFVELVKRMDADAEFPPLIIRPHPSEDIRLWYKHLAGLQRVKIIFEGEISPWLYASRGLLHRGCTTAVQAYVGETPVLYWVGGQAAIKYETLSYQVSQPVANYSALKLACQAIMSGNFELPVSVEVDSKLCVDEELACDKIVASLKNMAVTNEMPFGLPGWKRKLRFVWGHVNEYREARGWGYARKKLAKAQRKMAGGIHQQEVSTVAYKLIPDFSGSITECDFNLVEVEA